MQFNGSGAKLAYSIREAVHASSLSRSTIYNHIAAGRLKSKRIGGRVIIPAESLHELLSDEA
ncbi:MAG: helix-turn-helix domain-containing protein [Thermomicrobiales bacterium]